MGVSVDDSEFERRMAEVRKKYFELGQRHRETELRWLARGRKAVSRALEESSTAATRMQHRVTTGVHKVMGSEEYKKKALEVNARLITALSILEDAITRRDEEISRLRARVAELEGISNG